MTEPQGRRRVVLAEDDDEMRKAICELVAGPGVEVAAASSGGEIIRLLSERDRVDLVVTDVRMPWMAGPIDSSFVGSSFLARMLPRFRRLQRRGWGRQPPSA